MTYPNESTASDGGGQARSATSRRVVLRTYTRPDPQPTVDTYGQEQDTEHSLTPQPMSPAPRMTAPIYGSGTTRPADDTAAIERNLDQTRSELAGTIGALEQRLRPKRLIDEAKEAAQEAASDLVHSAKASVRGATIGKVENMSRDMRDRVEDTRSSLMDTIRENPLPAAMAGLSLGWLMMNRASGSSSRRRRRMASYGYTGYEDYRAYGGPRYAGYESEQHHGVGAVVDEARERAAHAAERARGAAGDVAERAGDLADTAGEVVGRAGERAGEFAGEFGERATGAGSTLWDVVSRNPIPAAMVALGFGMLMRNGGGSDHDEWDGNGSMYGSAYGESNTNRGGYGAGYGVGTRIGDAVGGVTGAVDDARETVTDAAGEAASHVQDWGRGMGRQVGRAGGRAGSIFSQQPLAVGALALGLGAAAGLMAPSTERENQWMGEARDSVLDRAQEVAQQTGEKVQKVAEETVHTVQREAKAANLTVE